jgi:hypothetical protein
MGDLPGRNLKSGYPQLFQQVGAGFIERAGEKENAAIATMIEQDAVIAVRQFQTAQHLALGFRRVMVALVIGQRRMDRSQLIGVKALELDRVGSRFDGHIHQFLGAGELAIMVHPALGDDEARVAGSDGATGDAKLV